MATMDLFRNSAFETRELTEAINVVPNQWGAIGELGLFTDKAIRTKMFQVESKNGLLQLIQSTEREAPLLGMRRGKRDLKDFSVRRFGLESRITAEDIDSIRAFGTEGELQTALSEVNDRLIALRGNLDITREYLRAGALRGVVLDADGSTIVDLYQAFGVTPKAVDFAFATTSDFALKAREVTRHIENNLMGDTSTSVMALCSIGWWDKLMANADFKDAYKFFASVANPLRDDLRNTGVYWQGIYWKEYMGSAQTPNEDGTWTTRKFIPDNEARFFPLGTRSTFRQFNAPAPRLDTVNTPGQPFYSALAADPKWSEWIDVRGEMNTLPMCMRPGVLVRGYSTN